MTTAASFDALECRADELTVGDILLDGQQPVHVTAIHTLTDAATGAGYVRITARHYDVYGETDAFTITERTTTVRLIALHDDGSDVDIDTDETLDVETFADICGEDVDADLALTRRALRAVPR